MLSKPRLPTNFRRTPDELRRTSGDQPTNSDELLPKSPTNSDELLAIPDELRRTFCVSVVKTETPDELPTNSRRTPTNLCPSPTNFSPRDARRTPTNFGLNADELPTNSRRTPTNFLCKCCPNRMSRRTPDELPTNSDELPAIRRRTPTNFCPSSRRTPTNFRATQLTSLLFLCLFLTFSNFCMVFVFWLDFLSDLAKILDFRWFCI